jgi:CRISPR-associated protein Csm3
MEPAQAPRLTHKILMCGEIEAITALHIGGNDAGLSIGGADKLVVRNAIDNTPYIPGSSLKGRMRSLLEKANCAGSCNGFKVTINERDKEPKLGPCSCEDPDQEPCPVCLVFGVAASTARKFKADQPYAGAARLLVRDAVLSNRKFLENPRLRLDMPYTELKTEVSIDRLTSAANPRQFERVPVGAKFAFELVLNVFKHDNTDEYRQLVEQGLALVAEDALGGQSSRGYGKVVITLNRQIKLAVEQYPQWKELKQTPEGNLLHNGPRTFGSRIVKAAVVEAPAD